MMGALPAARLLAVDDAEQPALEMQLLSEPKRSFGIARAGDFLLAPGLVYLQTGSVGPSPKPVIDRAIAAWVELETNPVFHAYKHFLPDLEVVRSKAAALLRCTHDELILTKSTTDGMNAVATGLDLAPGDHVITTEQEHGGGRNCWEYLVRRRGIVLDEVAIPPGENDAQAIIERFQKAITPRTRVLSFSHVLYSTGLRMPVAELSALARMHGCLAIVDGAQAAGGIDVDVSSLGCHVYATTGHKWLLGPKGTGMLYLREDARERVQLIAEQDSRKAQNESTGVLNVPGMLGLGATIDYVRALGIGKIEAHNLELRNRLFEMLGQVPKVRVVSPPPGPLASPLVTVQSLENITTGEVVQRMLEKHQVMLKGLPKLPNGIRFSTHLFNSMEDVERAVAAMQAEFA